MCRDTHEVLLFTPGTDDLEAFIVVDGGATMIALPVSNDEGTFLARSDNPQARVVAALTAMHFERECAHAR